MNPEYNIPNAYNPSFTPVGKKQKLIVVGMIFGILILVVAGYLFINSRKDPNLASMETIYATNAEIIRVSDLALESQTITAKGSNLAANAKATAISNKKVAEEAIVNEYNGGISKELTASGTDQANDDKLKQGELLGDVDKAYADVLKQLLIKSNAAIAKIETSQEIESQLEAMAKSNETLFDSAQ